jgi:hypothetical protein
MKPLTGVVELKARGLLGGLLVSLILCWALPAWADTPKIQRDQLADDAIGEEQIDWGDGSEQVDASDMPVDDGAWVNLAPATAYVQAAFDAIDSWMGGITTGYWQRNGTDLSPATVGDDVLMNPTELIKVEGSAADSIKWYSYVTGDSYGRFQAKADGTLGWGDGSGAVDLTMYRGAAGEAAITGNLSLGAHHLALGKIATPGAAASDTGLIYFDTTTERPYVVDDAGAAACLAIQNVVTLPGQYLAHLAWGYSDVQNLAAPVSAQVYNSYDWTNHKQATGYGSWDWIASRDQRIPDYAQSKLYTAGQMDYNGCDTIKLRAKVWLQNSVVVGSAPGGGSYWDSIKFHLSENDGSHSTVSADLQSGLADSAWRIIEADFDISSWTVGAEEGLYFGLEFTGVEVDDPDPDPQNAWQYWVGIEWIEAIAWIN